MADKSIANDAAKHKDIQRTLKRMTPEKAFEGHDIYEYFGKRVIEHTTSNGHVLAIKTMTAPWEDDRVDRARSEAAMMQYAATHGVLAPQVRGVYDIVTTRPKKPLDVALVSDRVPGVTLAEVWRDLGAAEQEDLKRQLREQLNRMRQVTLPYVGRPEKQPTYNIYDRIRTSYCGPFEDEESFDEWCIQRVAVGFLNIQRTRWAKWVQKESRKSSGRFVLTHGDLTPRNIMYKDGKITGIIDWERSGFFPEYAEYAFAVKLGHEIEKWWKPVLEEVLEPCPKKRLELTKLVEDRGW